MNYKIVNCNYKYMIAQLANTVRIYYFKSLFANEGHYSSKVKCVEQKLNICQR